MTIMKGIGTCLWLSAAILCWFFEGGKAMTVDEVLSIYQISVRVGSTVTPPGDGVLERVARSVERRNVSVRLSDLADELNPEILDGEKVQAFLEGLPSVPGETLTRLRGRTLYLNTMPLGASQPVLASAIRQRYKLLLPAEELGEVVTQADIDAVIDADTARRRSSMAHDALLRYSQHVSQLDARLSAINHDASERATLLREVSEARWRCHAAALTWRDNLQYLVRIKPTVAVQQELQEANAAAKKYLAPPRTGMPARTG